MIYAYNTSSGMLVISAEPPLNRNQKYYTFEELPEGDGPLYLVNGTLVRTKNPDPPAPNELREEAYNTQAIISFGGEMLTVTQASQKWQYYAAEGNTAKTDELTALIAEAKTKIREQYPDE